ncbi:vanadium nitrogenase [Roseburia hominis]|nr:vanadium nitrogenase [Roseburia hominis]
MLFLGQFLQYVIIMLILAAIGVAGIFVGKKLRQKKDAKQALDSHEEK